MLKLVLKGLLLCFVGSVIASSKQEVQTRLQVIDPRIEVVELKDAPISGFYEVQLNSGDLLYMSKEEDYMFAGSLLEFTQNGIIDITEVARTRVRSKAIRDIPVDEQVVFAAEGETKAVVQIFTDATCPYCSRLHKEVPELNSQGVEVRYLAFPRQGVQGPGFDELVNVWCADDQQQAMTDAKAGKSIANKQCDHPINKQYELGRKLGVQGTPAIFLPDGKVIPGYVPADKLLSELAL